MNKTSTASISSADGLCKGGPSIFDARGLEKLRTHFRLDPESMRQLRNQLCKQFRDDGTATSVLPADANVRLHTLQVDQRCDSQIDGATKLLMRTTRGMLIETVLLRIATGRTTVCVSSQIGCAAACDFCATGKMGVAQDLTADEILDQVVLAGQLVAHENRRVRNIVFMGMGEPFHNESHLLESLRILTSAEYFCHPPSRILVSSVGVTDGMIRCAERFPEVNLAISLHSVRSKVRERLIPLARKYPLEQLRSTLQRLNQIQQCPVMVEYLMLGGVNDSNDNARELIEWLKGLEVHVNLIPYNAIDDAPHLVGSTKESTQAFARLLKASGLKATTRYSLGSDIAAACGQLVRRENRRLAEKLSTASE